MGRFVRSASLVAVCLLFFSPSLPADRVRSLPELADSFSDSSGSINFISSDRSRISGDSVFFVSGTFGSNEDHLKWFDDSEDHPGNAWGWRKDHHHDHDSNGGWSSGDQGNEDTDRDSGNAGTTSGDPSTPAVPESSVLVLLSPALAAFLLKSLRRATI